MIRDVHSESGSRIRILIFYPYRIRIRIRNTVYEYDRKGNGAASTCVRVFCTGVQVFHQGGAVPYIIDNWAYKVRALTCLGTGR